MRTLTVAFAALSLLVAGCNGGDLTSVGGPSLGQDDPTPGGDGDQGVDPSDPHNGGDGDEIVPPTAPSSDDTDGDGIPNADDNIPCQAFYIKIWNQDVSSAEVALNEQVIAPADFFPTDEVIVQFINPVIGTNYIDFGGKLAGSPEDELHTEIWSVTPAQVWFHETMIRGNGQPEEVNAAFDIDVSC